MHDPIDHVRDRLGRQDQRLTPQRETVLRVLLEHANEHLTAEEVYLEARGAAPDLGMATVYRTLDLFERLGVVHRLDAGQGVARYEFRPEGEGHYHHHLICLECGRILEFERDLLEPVERAVEKETGFLVIDHSLLLFGLCPDCRRTGPDAPSQGASPPRPDVGERDPGASPGASS
ncbi:Fur family transcriptional regulator [Limnochorda pilosa]|uniref:Fur family transcriptional regulator n=1 Tax=Limnochorda pilosa TaxID=1555112 RepID=A0A0K2SNE7_LIMPI|nr:Fur family transcriptional regulator [Limnochorda pilosa]BAS28635.1 Fur family transcriptional regulator [Limnochorda pilosa]